MLIADGADAAEVLDALPALRPLVGRMEMFSKEGSPLVIVDFAHTPDGIEKSLMAAREHTKGILTCVFGAGGDRDHGKRPLMAASAEKFADRVFVTDDNPRSEDPAAIRRDVAAGFTLLTAPRPSARRFCPQKRATLSRSSGRATRSSRSWGRKCFRGQIRGQSGKSSASRAEFARHAAKAPGYVPGVLLKRRIRKESAGDRFQTVRA